MRVNNKGGIPPCDRRLDRRKVAIAAVAALFLFATVSAQAAPTPTTFVVRPDLSSISASLTLDLSAVFPGGPFPPGTILLPLDEQFPGSDVTAITGTIDALLDPGVSIELLATGLMPLAPNASPGAGGTPGLYSPASPPAGAYPKGTTAGANFGLEGGGGGIGVVQSQHSTVLTTYFAPGARALTGTSFDYAPSGGGDGFSDFLLMLAGESNLAATSTLPDITSDLTLLPLAEMDSATPGSGLKPSWDPLDLTAGPLGTLTLPIESVQVATVSGIDLVTTNYGFIYATPVPEPSSMVLLGFGVVGLLAVGRRLRKRTA